MSEIFAINRAKIRAWAAAHAGFIVLFLSACSGGGGSTPPPPPPPPPNVVTAGIQTGATDIYVAGEQITLAWNNTAQATCTGTGLLSGSLAATGTKQVAVPEGESSFSVTCAGVSSPTTQLNALPARTVIKDAVFEQALIDMKVDDVIDGSVDTTKVLAVTKMGILEGGGYDMGPGILRANTGTRYVADATGLENFRHLDYLRFEGQHLTSIDLSKAAALTFVSLWKEPITTLDVSHNPKLQTLGVSETALSTVDLSALPALVELDAQVLDPEEGGPTVPYVTSNGTTVVGFTHFDFSHNPNLTALLAEGNRLTSVDISHNSKLESAVFQYNHLTSITVGQVPALRALAVGNNALTSLDLSGTAIANPPTGQQGLVTTNNPGLTQVQVKDGAAFTSWCTTAHNAWQNNDGSYGDCEVDATTTFVTKQ